MRFIFLFNVLLVLSPLSSLNLHAEGNCPSGSYPIGGGNAGWTGCAPIPGYGGGGGEQRAPMPPAQVWQDRWGALAGDKQKGIIGAVIDSPGKSAAEQTAMTDCAAKGGVQCKLENTYRNTCMAMTVGDWGYNIESRVNQDEAITIGLQKCREGDKNCKTFYSACSLPVRIR